MAARTYGNMKNSYDLVLGRKVIVKLVLCTLQLKILNNGYHIYNKLLE